ncbi:hypothetical protein [Peptoniphilus sp. HCN-40583]|uniref:hypothetical protein n=1 Tax=Peptoniphilus sp. HCN-40583 TaxID=3134662 RepID=UPI0030BAFE8E
MTKRKTSDAQIRAIKKWRDDNKEAHRIASYRSTARTFVRHYATEEDMEELREIFEKENENFTKNS